MNTKEKHELIVKAVNTQGMEKQLQHFHEEIGELMTSISHYKRGRCTKEQLMVELVDARMMIDAVEEAFQVDRKEYLKIEDKQWNKFASQMEERATND